MEIGCSSVFDISDLLGGFSQVKVIRSFKSELERQSEPEIDRLTRRGRSREFSKIFYFV